MKALFDKHRLFLQVGFVGAVGVVIQTVLLTIFVERLHWNPVLGNTLAAELAILTNFFINNAWTFETRTRRPLLLRLFIFNVGVCGSILLQALCIWAGIHFIDARLYLLYMAIGVSVGLVINYFFYTRLVWLPPSNTPQK